jgi:hypothetical protein
MKGVVLPYDCAVPLWTLAEPTPIAASIGSEEVTTSVTTMNAYRRGGPLSPCARCRPPRAKAWRKAWSNAWPRPRRCRAPVRSSQCGTATLPSGAVRPTNRGIRSYSVIPSAPQGD